MEQPESCGKPKNTHKLKYVGAKQTQMGGEEP